MFYLYKLINLTLKGVLTVPMVMAVSTIAVVIVWTTLHVTNKPVSVTTDVNRDIQIVTVAKVL